jgi:hypothetical protein
MGKEGQGIGKGNPISITTGMEKAGTILRDASMKGKRNMKPKPQCPNCKSQK